MRKRKIKWREREKEGMLIKKGLGEKKKRKKIKRDVRKRKDKKERKKE